MDSASLRQIIASIDAALLVFTANEGHLTTADIRVQSMLSALRFQLLADLAEQRGKAGDSTARGGSSGSPKNDR